MKIPLSLIVVGTRQRVDLGDIPSLANSLKAHGQIHNIGLVPLPNGKYKLIFGRRRLAAAESLGWPEIEATVRPDLSPIDEQLLEFEEDYARKNRTWQEGCIAIRTINNFYRAAKMRGDIESWSTRALERITGVSNMKLNYMVRLGEALGAEPRDEELWSADAWTSALQVLMARYIKLIEAEMERRKPPTVVLESSPVEDIDLSDGAVQPLYPTPEKAIVYVQGFPWSWDDERAHAWRGATSLVLSYGPSFLPHLNAELRPGGYAITWGGGSIDELDCQPHSLVWNHILTPDKDLWPFAGNATYASVFRKGTPTQEFESPSGSVISAVPDDDPTVLPAAVVDFSIAKLCTERMAVVIPCGVNPIHIAELGRVPVWYEPDKERFAAKFAALKAFYESLIPNCEVRLREVT